MCVMALFYCDKIVELLMEIIIYHKLAPFYSIKSAKKNLCMFHVQVQEVQ